MNIVRASSGEGIYETLLETDSHKLISDEPVSNGGNDRGFSPQQLVAAALASCTSITLKMYAKRKNWILKDLFVTVRYQGDDKHNILNMATEIEIRDNLSEEQKEKLLQIAGHCPVHKALSGNVPMTTSLK